LSDKNGLIETEICEKLSALRMGAYSKQIIDGCCLGRVFQGKSVIWLDILLYR